MDEVITRKDCVGIDIYDAEVHIRTKDGAQFTLNVQRDVTVAELKEMIAPIKGIPPKEQLLRYAGKQLIDSWKLWDCYKELSKNSVGVYLYNLIWKPNRDCPFDRITLYLERELFGGFYGILGRDHQHFDPANDKDLRDSWWTSKKDIKYQILGGLVSFLPHGSYIKAIKVWDVYESNVWCGESGEQGEWAVAYHGTTSSSIAQIVQSGGLKEEFSTRQAYGEGIYCSPCPNIALDYATSYEFLGKKYKMILQVRVDPERLNVFPREFGDYWVVPESAVRLYGVCIYPL